MRAIKGLGDIRSQQWRIKWKTTWDMIWTLALYESLWVFSSLHKTKHLAVLKGRPPVGKLALSLGHIMMCWVTLEDSITRNPAQEETVSNAAISLNPKP